jgi:hypothetical protein
MASPPVKKLKEDLREAIARLESKLSVEKNERARVTTKLTIDGLKKKLSAVKDDAKGNL